MVLAPERSGVPDRACEASPRRGSREIRVLAHSVLGCLAAWLLGCSAARLRCSVRARDTEQQEPLLRKRPNWGSNGLRLCGPAAPLVPEGKIFWGISGYKETPDGMGVRGSLFVTWSLLGNLFGYLLDWFLHHCLSLSTEAKHNLVCTQNLGDGDTDLLVFV